MHSAARTGLVAAAVPERCQTFSESQRLSLDARDDPRTVLTTLARAFRTKVLDPESGRILRILIAGGDRLPQVVNAFSQNGLAISRGELAQ